MRIRVVHTGLAASFLLGLLAANGCSLPDLGVGGPLADPEAAAWALAGRAAFPSAARIMAERNPHGGPLTPGRQAALRPYFGDLVTRVQVVWNATLLDQWSAGRYAVRPSDWGGQTYGDRIYVNQPERPGDIGQLALLAHELVHSSQSERFGGLGNFGYEYFKGFYLAGMSYERNTLEQEATSTQSRFAVEVRRRPQV